MTDDSEVYDVSGMARDCAYTEKILTLWFTWASRVVFSLPIILPSFISLSPLVPSFYPFFCVCVHKCVRLGEGAHVRPGVHAEVRGHPKVSILTFRFVWEPFSLVVHSLVQPRWPKASGLPSMAPVSTAPVYYQVSEDPNSGLHVRKCFTC